MTLHVRIIVTCALASSLAVTGCGNKQADAKAKSKQEELVRVAPGEAGSAKAQPAESQGVPPPPPPPPSMSAPAKVSSAPAPAAAKADPFAGDPLRPYRAVPGELGQQRGDLEALQAAVDAYSFGKEGLPPPPLKDLADLVARGYLKRLPNPPPGKKWAYDAQKWKVSLVNQ